MFVRILVIISLFLPLADQLHAAVISGELRKWHPVTLLFDGPNTNENDATNPFTNYRLIVTFTNGSKTYVVHGHYAADGSASESSATSGDKWRVYFTPDAEGQWDYTVSFRTGANIALSDVAGAGTAVAPDGETGSFFINATDKTGTDFRGKGRLAYVGEHYLQFSETGEYFLKGGTDSPENLLGYWEFDQTSDQGGAATPGLINGLHQFAPHVSHWNTGDPTWQGGKGKGIIGALNYLASRGVNSAYFITYNLDGGDGKDTWMWTNSTERQRFDISKLDQWEIVFKHMDSLGIQMNVLLQETENDGSLGGNGNLNDIRKLYYKELISRYAHHLAIVWNMGEENTNTNAQRAAFAEYFHDKDPYDFPVTVHTWNDGGLSFYQGILDNPTYLQSYEMTSLQGTANNMNEWAIDIRNYSASKGKKWVICGDELDPAIKDDLSNLDYHREESVWGGLMGGGAGMEWYFGYQGTFGDLQSEDFTIVEPIWDQTKIAIDFFQNHLPFHEMEANNSLASASNGFNTPETFCFQKPGEIYAVYVQSGISNVTVSLNIAGTSQYTVQWFNPRTGGALQNGTVTNVTAVNGVISLGKNPENDNEDWLVLVKKTGVVTAPEINIRQGAINIPSGGSHTFGNTNVSAFTDVVFTVQNTGTAALTLNIPVSVSGDYAVFSQPSANVAPSGSTTFTIRFTPTAGGNRTGILVVNNNDADEGGYIVNFTGTGVVIPPTSTTWTGNIDDDWFNTLNWTDGAPTASLDVVIPNVAPNDFPVIQGPPGTVAHGKNFTINSGANITISNLNNVEMVVHGNLTNNGQMLGTGRLTFNGPAHSLTMPTSFSGVLQVKAGSTLNTNGNLTLEDGATLLHGTGTPGGGGTVSGAIKMKRTGNAGAQVYTYWTSPVAGANVNLLGGNLYSYNPLLATDQTVSGLRNGWVSVSGSMAAGKGYISQGMPQILFNGDAHEGDYAVSISKNGATTVGWNLVGNPYPSGLDAAAFIAANSGIIYGSLYFWDDDASGGSGWSAAQDYAVWNGAGSVTGPNSATLFTGHIAAGQGFFVEKLNDGAADIQFTNAMRSEKNNAFFKMAPVKRIKISAVGPTGLYNETLVAFLNDATDGEDHLYDAKKMKGNDKIALYTKIQNGIYAIQGVPALTEDRVITMGIDAGIAGDYTLNLRSLEHIDETVTITLEDTYTGHFQSLRLNPVYTFYATAGSHENRFRLHFNQPLQFEVTDATCSGNDGMLALEQQGTKLWNYTLTDEKGLIVARRADFNGINISTGLTEGMYRLTLTDNDGYRIEKMVRIKGKARVASVFAAQATTVFENESVIFQNQSLGANSYAWDFGDGNHSANENPVHAYSAAGVYEVTLLAENDDCEAVRTAAITVLKKDGATGIEEQEAEVKIFAIEHVIHIDLPAAGENGSTASVYDALGKQLATANLTAGMNRIELNHFSGAYCFLRLEREGEITGAKLALITR